MGTLIPFAVEIFPVCSSAARTPFAFLLHSTLSRSKALVKSLHLHSPRRQMSNKNKNKNSKKRNSASVRSALLVGAGVLAAAAFTGSEAAQGRHTEIISFTGVNGQQPSSGPTCCGLRMER